MVDTFLWIDEFYQDKQYLTLHKHLLYTLHKHLLCYFVNFVESINFPNAYMCKLFDFSYSSLNAIT